MVWSQWFDLNSFEVANQAPATCGVFCVAHKTAAVAYPGGSSATVLLGVAADRQRGLRSVLAELVAGRRDDLEMERRRETGGLRFCFQANLGDAAGSLYAGVLADFVRQYGTPPRCNGVG